MEPELDKSRKEGKYVDFTIYAEGKPFPVHRLVLDAKSEYFKLLFSVDMKEKKEQSCEANVVTALGVERALDFMYGNELVVENETVEEVLKVCHLWQLSTAVKQCERFVMEILHLDNCIFFRRLSNLYDMQDLTDKCIDFILAHLGELKAKLELDDLRMLLTTIGTKKVCAEKLWNFCSGWHQIQPKEGGESALCKMIKVFPVQKFQILKFHDVVWKSTHMTNCESCKEHTAKKFIRAVQLEDIDVQNCLFVKHLSKLFKEDAAEQLINNYIVLNHRSVFAMPGFLEVEEDDLLKYVTSLSDQCSVEEFSTIIKWIQQQTPDRENMFPKLFDDTVIETAGQFLSDIRGLRQDMGLGTWILKTEHCFFIKQLAEKYHCTKVQNTVDSYIVQHLEVVSKQPEFMELPLLYIAKYIKLADISYQALWNIVMRWTNHDMESRKHVFPALLESLPLDKFLFAFLKDTVLKCGLFSESDVCLTQCVLVRAIDVENSNAQLKAKLYKAEGEVARKTTQISTMSTETYKLNEKIYQLSRQLGKY